MQMRGGWYPRIIHLGSSEICIIFHIIWKPDPIVVFPFTQNISITLLTSIYVKFRLQSICPFSSAISGYEGMFLLVHLLQKVVVIRWMVVLQVFLAFFKALTQLFCLRFTIEIFCHFLQLCDGQNSLAPSHRLSLFLSIIRKEEDTFMDIHKHLPKSVNTSRLWRDSREILAN